MSRQQVNNNSENSKEKLKRQINLSLIAVRNYYMNRSYNGGGERIDIFSSSTPITKKLAVLEDLFSAYKNNANSLIEEINKEIDDLQNTQEDLKEAIKSRSDLALFALYHNIKSDLDQAAKNGEMTVDEQEKWLEYKYSMASDDKFIALEQKADYQTFEEADKITVLKSQDIKTATANLENSITQTNNNEELLQHLIKNLAENNLAKSINDKTKQLDDKSAMKKWLEVASKFILDDKVINAVSTKVEMQQKLSQFATDVATLSKNYKESEKEAKKQALKSSSRINKLRHRVRKSASNVRKMLIKGRKSLDLEQSLNYKLSEKTEPIAEEQARREQQPKTLEFGLKRASQIAKTDKVEAVIFLSQENLFSSVQQKLISLNINEFTKINDLLPTIKEIRQNEDLAKKAMTKILSSNNSEQNLALFFKNISIAHSLELQANNNHPEILTKVLKDIVEQDKKSREASHSARRSNFIRRNFARVNKSIADDSNIMSQSNQSFAENAVAAISLFLEEEQIDETNKTPQSDSYRQQLITSLSAFKEDYLRENNLRKANLEFISFLTNNRSVSKTSNNYFKDKNNNVYQIDANGKILFLDPETNKFRYLTASELKEHKERILYNEENLDQEHEGLAWEDEFNPTNHSSGNGFEGEFWPNNAALLETKALPNVLSPEENEAALINEKAQQTNLLASFNFPEAPPKNVEQSKESGVFTDRSNSNVSFQSELSDLAKLSSLLDSNEKAIKSENGGAINYQMDNKVYQFFEEKAYLCIIDQNNNLSEPVELSLDEISEIIIDLEEKQEKEPNTTVEKPNGERTITKEQFRSLSQAHQASSIC